MPLLKKNFEPTDFADAECRVTGFAPFESPHAVAYRIWVCRCGEGYWFQRHEWAKEGRNSTEMGEWLFTGYSPRRAFPAHMIDAPELEDI